MASFSCEDKIFSNYRVSPIDACTYGIPGQVPYPYRGETSQSLLDNFFVETQVCPTWNVLSDFSKPNEKCEPSYVPRVTGNSRIYPSSLTPHGGSFAK
jgi:hypothetical protein